MSQRTAPDIRRAIAEFRQAGFTAAEIASDLGLHRSSIHRWAAGTRRPNNANLAALRELIDARYSQLIHRRALPVAALHLRQAVEALEDPAERAAFEAAMKAKHAAIVAARQTQTPSITRLVDPFALVASAPMPEQVMWS